MAVVFNQIAVQFNPFILIFNVNNFYFFIFYRQDSKRSIQESFAYEDESMPNVVSTE